MCILKHGGCRCIFAALFGLGASAVASILAAPRFRRRAKTFTGEELMRDGIVPNCGKAMEVCDRFIAVSRETRRRFDGG